MARKPRVHYPGAVYHVMLRGNARQDIFADDEDRRGFYALLAEGVERFGYRLHGFCLMSNHVHLAAQVGALALSRIMQHLGFRYTQWFNRRRARVGHLFQGRYKAVLVDAESYLLELVRYIHLNPVRAALVKAPERYPWSGHRAYLGKERLGWLETRWVLSQFGRNTTRARERYARFVAEGRGEGRREEFHRDSTQGRILGDDRFAEEAMARAGRQERRAVNLGEVLGAVCARLGISEEELAVAGKARAGSQGRALTAWLVRQVPELSLQEAACRLGRDISSLSAAATRLEGRVREDTELARMIAQLKADLRIA